MLPWPVRMPNPCGWPWPGRARIPAPPTARAAVPGCDRERSQPGNRCRRREPGMARRTSRSARTTSAIPRPSPLPSSGRVPWTVPGGHPGYRSNGVPVWGIERHSKQNRPTPGGLSVGGGSKETKGGNSMRNPPISGKFWNWNWAWGPTNCGLKIWAWVKGGSLLRTLASCIFQVVIVVVL